MPYESQIMKKSASICSALFACIAVLALADQPGWGNDGDELLFYTVLARERSAGELRITVQGRRWTSRYHFSDRGRGPELESTILVNDDGLPVTLHNVGSSYLKAPVDERYEWTEAAATWSSRAEQDTARVSEPSFYLAANPVPTEYGLLARALLRDSDRRLRLLPGGFATGHVGSRVRLEGSGGETAEPRLVLVSGIDLQPIPIWLDARDRLFATDFGDRATGAEAVVRRGWESQLPVMVEAQRQALAQWTRQLTKHLGRTFASGLLIENARLFDAVSGSLRHGESVLVQGDRITAVGLPRSFVPPQGVEVLDAEGGVLIPGLIDMHAHLSESDALLAVASGVTTVRDLGNDVDALLELDERIRQGDAIGPRIFWYGMVDAPGPFQGPAQELVTSAEEAREAVERFARRGAKGVKIYSSVPRALVPVLVEEAHARGLRVAGHVPAELTASEAVGLGFDELNHLNFLFLNFWADEIGDTRTAERVVAVAERGARLDLGTAQVRAFLDLLDAKHVVVDPTLVIFQLVLTSRPGIAPEGFEPLVGKLPYRFSQRMLAAELGLPAPGEKDQLYRESFSRMMEMTVRLYRRGIRIVAGTDLMLNGLVLPRELVLYAEAGIPPSEVLRLATLGAAEVLEEQQDLGSITPGKRADFFLVHGKPTEHLEDLYGVEWTIKDGILYRTAAILQALGVATEDGGS